MGFLIVVLTLGSNRMDSIVERSGLFIAELVPMGQSHGFASAIFLTMIAVLVYGGVLVVADRVGQVAVQVT